MKVGAATLLEVRAEDRVRVRRPSLHEGRDRIGVPIAHDGSGMRGRGLGTGPGVEPRLDLTWRAGRGPIVVTVTSAPVISRSPSSGMSTQSGRLFIS